MKKFKLTMIVGCIFILGACTDKNDNLFETNKKSTCLKYSKVPYIPLVKRALPQVKTQEDSKWDNLGMGYKAFKYPFISTQNTTFKVIDINRIDNDEKHKDLLSKRNTSESFSSFRSFSSFKEYETEIYTKFKKSIKIKGGFLGIVKSRFKKGFSFMSKDIDKESEEKIFGEVEIGLKTKSFSINLLDEKQIYSFLTFRFKHDYYNSSPKDLLENYGIGVLTSYTAGGKAFATYRGETSSSMSKKERESNFDLAVRGSFGGILGGIISGGANIITEAEKKMAEAAKSKFTQFEMSIRTYGGNPGLGIPNFIGPDVPDTLNIDLKEWGKSVSNPEFYEINNIDEEGLTPIQFFIKEDNIRKNLLNFLADTTSVDSSQFNVDPRQPVFYIDQGGYGSDVYIMTRFGDLIRISDGKLRRIKAGNGGPIEFYVDPITTDGFPIRCKAVEEEDEIENTSSLNKSMDVYYCISDKPNAEFDDYLFSGIKKPYSGLKYDLSGFNKDELCIYKLKNDFSEIRYLKVKTQTTTYAIAIFDDYIENIYGLLLNDIPIYEVSTDYLKDLTIIAL